VQLNLGDDAVDDLELYKAEVPDGETERIVIGLGIAQGGEKLLAVG